MPFAFEFDPNLTVGALLTLPDEPALPGWPAPSASNAAAETRTRSSRSLPLTADLVLREPARRGHAPPLPADLAHRVAIEFEGIPGPGTRGRSSPSAAMLSPGRSVACPSEPIVRLCRRRDRPPRAPPVARHPDRRPRPRLGPTPRSARSGPARSPPTGWTSGSSAAEAMVGLVAEWTRPAVSRTRSCACRFASPLPALGPARFPPRRLRWPLIQALSVVWSGF